ncbi:hypothetical protein KY338_03455 [Candidatus Woesearchaeota archaeon]|nr:hypothetical protein [Candidatus Woesearchaeota archaeon]MBW3005340.1 hypothetical protein [Candidatus Woesearchaeota archaeon]
MKLLFVESFRKIDKRFVYVVLFDFLFYAGLALSVILFLKLLAWGLGSLHQLPGKFLAMSRMSDFGQLGAGAEDLGLLLNQFKAKLFVAFVVFWLFVVLVFTFFKGLAWSFVLGQKIDRKFLIKFFKLNLWWLGIIAGMFLVVFWLTKPAATGFSVMLLLALALYFTPVFYALFNPKKDVRDLFARLWHVGIERFYFFILPFIAAKLVLFVFLAVMAVVLLAVVPDIALYGLFACFVVWQSWFKYYVCLVAGRIK